MLKCTFCHNSLRAGQTGLDPAQSHQSQPAMTCCLCSPGDRNKLPDPFSHLWVWQNLAKPVLSTRFERCSEVCFSSVPTGTHLWVLHCNPALAAFWGTESSLHRFHIHSHSLPTTSPLISCNSNFQGHSWYSMMCWPLLHGNSQAQWRITCWRHAWGSGQHHCRKNWFPDVVASGFRNFSRGRDMPRVKCK